LIIDGIIACLIGINILFAGGQLVRQSFRRLMDASDPELLERIATDLVANRRPDWVDIHQLRAWRSGAVVHIDLHLVLPVEMSLAKAHHEAKILEAILVKTFDGNADVLIHMDPCEPAECPVCGLESCALRSHGRDPETIWNRERLIRASAAD
jgi:divalent metal cation (Fe/Co/Zn/Cd) transporter